MLPDPGQREGLHRLSWVGTELVIPQGGSVGTALEDGVGRGDLGPYVCF